MRKGMPANMKHFNYLINMPQLCKPTSCYGCGACIAACSRNAISFNYDKYGFLYPTIDKHSCIDCKLCEKKCPVLNKVDIKFPIATYACHASNNSERIKSSSGAIATLLAKQTIQEGGIVYGVAASFNKIQELQLRHIRCTTIEEIEKLRGSKYIQSDITHIFVQLKEDIRKRRKVLFIGTPCQVAGIKSVFGKYENLYLIDLVCHGTPSTKMLCETLPKNIDVTKETIMEFRVNTKYHFTLRNGIRTIYERPLHKDYFLKAFFTGVLFRPSCFKCAYARKERISDMTVGDFWGYRGNAIKNHDKGVSLVLINTIKGKEIYDKIRKCIIQEKRPLQEVVESNAQLRYPFHRTIRERIFKHLYPYFGFSISLWMAMPDRLLGTKIKHLI